MASIATSLLAWVCAPAILRATAPAAASARAWALAAYRLAPAAAALAVTSLVLAPGYFRHEQRARLEDVGVLFAACAMGGALILLASLVRAGLAITRTARLRRAWLAHAQSVSIEGMAAYEIETRFPLVAMLGAIRPRLFISSAVLRACTPEELAAIVQHERRHVSAGDNAIRLMMDAAPDLLSVTRRSAAIGDAWHQAVEHRADEAAPERLTLASALVRVARMAGDARPVRLPASALYRGEGIEERVRRLLAAAPDGRSRGMVRLLTAVSLAASAGIAAAAFSPRISQLSHDLLEAVVSLR